MAIGVAYLLERLESAANAAAAADRWADEDIQDLTLEVAEFVAGALDVRDLDLSSLPGRNSTASRLAG